MKKKLILILSISTILIGGVIIITCLFINYKKDRTFRLNLCIEEANAKRDDLWNANCDEEGYISSMDTIEWIEARYEQDLQNCYRLYD